MIPAQPTGDVLEGTVDRVTFHSEETGFAVLKVKVKKERDLIAVIGTVSQVVAGEEVKATGEWVVDKQHGRQFKATRIDTVPPNSPEGIVKFLGSGLVKGIGPVYAQRLVDKFGVEVFDIIEHESGKLESVDGIGKKRRLVIKNSWNETRATRGIMSFLLGHGVSTNRAFRIYKTYGEDAIKRMEEDPYCLARDIRGIGFKTADQIARNFGIGENDPRRARAGVEHVLHECTHQGHCAYPRQGLIDEAQRILGMEEVPIVDAINAGLKDKRLILEAQFHDDPLIYLKALYDAEVELAMIIQQLNEGNAPLADIDTAKALDWVSDKIGLELAPGQRDAVKAALCSKVLIITGGPGVGKTTILNAIIKILGAKKLDILLAAPTGRAAKRMSEATGREAKTLHRLLAFDAKTGGFKHGLGHPLDCDVLVVDESSMMDLPLMHKVAQAMPLEGVLILVGDVDQLPSVGPGTILQSMIDSRAVPVARLTEVFRQAAESGIISNAHRVNEGRMPNFGEANSDDDFYFVKAEEPEQALNLMIKLIRDNIPKRFGLDPMKDIQLLTPMQRGVLGARNLNAELQQALNRHGEEIERFGFVFRDGDKVMQTMNNYDKEVYNGDLGIVVAVDAISRSMMVMFGKRRVEYDFQELDELVPAYATTIHKSQGSEFPCVIIPVHTTHYIMLQRNLLYTAITRGKQLVIVVGTERAVAMAVKNVDSNLRVSALKERLKGR